MTLESEAKTKWCPMIAQRTKFKRIDDPDAMDRCIGSACMMWRWIEPPYSNEHLKNWQEATGGPTGFCGLAGKP